MFNNSLYQRLNGSFTKVGQLETVADDNFKAERVSVVSISNNKGGFFCLLVFSISMKTDKLQHDFAALFFWEIFSKHSCPFTL